MLDVISIGSATEDVFVLVPAKNFKTNECVFRPGSKVEIGKMEYSTGGGAANTAVSFSRLGLSAGAIFVVGNDDSGKNIINELKNEKVNVSGAIIAKNQKTAYSVVLTGFGRDRVVLFYHGPMNMLAKAKINWKKARAKWLYISSLHATGATLKSVVAGARKKGMRIAINPGKKELKLGIKGLRSAIGIADIIIMNSREALMLTGSVDIHRNLAKLLEIGKIVVITEGSKGAHCTDGRHIYSATPLQVKIEDATGAGDAFGSGFVAAIIKGWDTEYAMTQASANAASVLMHLGTKNKLLKKSEIAKFIRKYGRGAKIARLEF